MKNVAFYVTAKMLDDWMTTLSVGNWDTSDSDLQPQAAPAGDLHVQGVRRRPLGGYQEQLHGENLEECKWNWYQHARRKASR